MDLELVPLPELLISETLPSESTVTCTLSVVVLWKQRSPSRRMTTCAVLRMSKFMNALHLYDKSLFKHSRVKSRSVFFSFF